MTKVVEYCTVCFQDATGYWGHTPVCSNPSCRQFLIDATNAELEMLAEQNKEGEEA